MQKPQVTEIQVRIDCNGCVQKIKKALHGINGKCWHVSEPLICALLPYKSQMIELSNGVWFVKTLVSEN